MSLQTHRQSNATPSSPTLRFVRPLVAAIVLLAAGVAEAALTTTKCLVQKRQAWSTLRKCEAGVDVKRLKDKPADLSSCRTKFQEKLAKIDAKAEKAAVACRYGANGDGTVTDYDTGLMWETKDGEVGGICFLLPDVVSHCVNFKFTWVDAHAYVGGTTLPIGDAVRPFLAGHADWRLPTRTELRTIVTEIGCSQDPCIDPIFGPTLVTLYWTSTTARSSPTFAWIVDFDGGISGFTSKTNTEVAVRAVRASL